jgi:hypothetical protein
MQQDMCVGTNKDTHTTLKKAQELGRCHATNKTNTGSLEGRGIIIHCKATC